jgi:hypothetical protein
MTTSSPSSSDPRVLTSAEVAARLRRSPRWFSLVRKRLQAAGFPPPLPGILGRPLWSTAAVDRWIAGEPPTAAGEEAMTIRLAERSRVISETKGRRRRP